MQRTPPNDLERYHRARADFEESRARMAEMEMRAKEGHLLDADKIRDGLIQIFGTARNRLLAIPRRLAPTLIGITDERAIADVLNQAIEEALISLCDTDIQKPAQAPSRRYPSKKTRTLARG